MNNEELIKTNTNPVGAGLVSAQEIKNNATHGITLIALIITIIILLILAGVVLSLTIGERGIFNTAKQSKKEYIIAEMKEELELALNDLKLEKQGEASLDDVTQSWADSNKLAEYETIIDAGDVVNEKTATMTKDGITVKFIIDEKLNIIDGEQITGNEEYQTITLNLEEGINIDNKRTKTPLNKPYNATLTAKGEYILETLTVTMGGQAVVTGENNTVDIQTGNISIGNVTGDIVITATAKKLELQISTPIIGITTSATESVKDNSQSKGIPLYINFSATLEGENCTITYKEDDTKEVPFEITKNGKYIFIIKGTYNGKTVTKEKEVVVSKYKSAVGLVQYDAGEWKKEEIQELENLKLYDVNVDHSIAPTLKIDDDSGINLTFGGFTYKGNNNNGLEGIITSRNKSINTSYDGWQLLETSEGENGKTYVTKIIHAGLPEQFVYYYYAGVNDGMAKYILSSGLELTNYNKTPSGKTLNSRNWDVYKDKELDAKGYIKDVHVFNMSEYEQVGGWNTGLGKDIVPLGIDYWITQDVFALGYLRFSRADIGTAEQGGTAGSLGVRPVVTFNSGVYIESGSGTDADPYILAKE